MDHFFSNILIALGVAITPVAGPTWIPYGITDTYKVEVDLTSVFVRQQSGSWEVFSQIRLTPFAPISVKGKTKKGAYYIDSVTAHCKGDKLTLNEVTLHADDGTVLEASKNLGDVQNPHIEGNFVTEYLDTMCNIPPPRRPRLLV